MAKQEKKLSGWISGDLKPKRVGVYERDIECPYTPYSLWDGQFWRGYCSSKHGAAIEGMRSVIQDAKWRGLARRPR